MEVKLKDTVLIESFRDKKIDGRIGVVVGFDKDSKLSVKVAIDEDYITFLEPEQLTVLVGDRVRNENVYEKCRRKNLGIAIRNRRRSMKVSFKKVEEIAGIDRERMRLLEEGKIYLKSCKKAQLLAWLLTDKYGNVPFKWGDLLEPKKEQTK